MALLVTPGAYNSDSYVLLQEAQTIIDTLGIDTAVWDALSDSEKENMLRLAADAIGSFFTFRGWKAYKNQRLAFPRAECQELYGLSLTEIPNEVKRAQCYIACQIITANFTARETTTVAETSSGDPGSIASFSVKGISVTFKNTSEAINASSIFEDFVLDKHAILHILLNNYITQIKILRNRPELLDPVQVSTTTTTTTTTV